MRLLRIAVRIVALFLLATSAAAQQAALVALGGSRLYVPAPAGMVAVDAERHVARNPDFLVPPGNRLLTVFVPVSASERGAPSRYAMVQTTRSETRASGADLATINQSLRSAALRTGNVVAQTNRALDARRVDIARHYGAPDLRVRAKGLHMHRPLLETSEILLWSAYLEMEASLEGRSLEIFRPAAFGFYPHAERMAFLYYYGDFETSADSPAFVSAAKSWAESLVSQNRRAQR